MVALTGLEKFSHLEDKIYRTIELTKSLRQEKESLEKELSLMRRNRGGSAAFEQQRLEKQVEALLAERDVIRSKVEAMLDAVAALDPEMAEELRLPLELSQFLVKAVWKPLPQPHPRSELKYTIRLITFAPTATQNISRNSPTLWTAACARFLPAR